MARWFGGKTRIWSANSALTLNWKKKSSAKTAYPPRRLAMQLAAPSATLRLSGNRLMRSGVGPVLNVSGETFVLRCGRCGEDRDLPQL